MATVDILTLLNWQTEEEGLYYLLLPELLAAAQVGGTAALLRLASLGVPMAGINWAQANEAAAEWARGYTYELVRELTETTKRSLQNAVSTFQSTPGMTRGELERMLLQGPGALPELTGKTGRIYTPGERAEMAAVTEVTRSSAEGELATMRSLGVAYVEPDPDNVPPKHVLCRCWLTWKTVDGVLRPIFNTNHDELVCEICGPLNGKDIGKGDVKGRKQVAPVAVAQAARGPIQEAMLSSNGRHMVSRGNNSFELMTRRNDVAAGDFDPDLEAERINGVIDNLRDVLANEAEFVRRIDDDGAAMVRHADWKVHGNIIFTGKEADYGAGVASEHSFRVFYGPYELKDRANVLGYAGKEFGLDPIYTVGHELHHAFGSSTELDKFSDAIALDYHLKLGNQLIPEIVTYELRSRSAYARTRASGQLAGDITRTRTMIAWLYKRHPDEMMAVWRQSHDTWPEYYPTAEEMVKKVQQWAR